MAYGNDIVIAKCDGCGERKTVAELKRKDATIERFCEQCLGPPYLKLVTCRNALEARDKQVEGDKPHQPYRYTQVD